MISSFQNRSVKVASDATNTTFAVTSNTKWTASTTSGWATVATTSGENNGEVKITFSENAADTERAADIVVTTEDGSITKTFKLTQNGVGGAALTEKTATIQFGTSNVKIDKASVTANDNQKNSWTITTTGTSSYTQQPTYSQVGKKDAPATNITFNTTLPEDAEVTSISADFGGFKGTTGKVSLKIGEKEVGTGALNGTTDITVKSTSTAVGNKVTITITNIAKGVKCYNIQVKYKTAN